MICKDCGFDNPKGVYRCQRCGNSLVPAIPRDSYINPYPPRKTMEPHQARKVLRIGMAAFIILIFLGLFSLVSGLFRNSSSNEEATVSFTAEDSNSAAYSEEIQESYIDPLFVPDEYIHDGMMTLPESDIKIGMPEYSDWQTDALISNTEYSCDFKLENGLNMIFDSYVADYPFSKSEEEEYFREAQKYLRLEGTNDQYFYTVENENGIVATIVDRIHGRNYVIEIYSDEESGNPSMKKEHDKRASYVLNHEILDPSSLADNEKNKE